MKIRNRKTTVLSKWVTLMAREVEEDKEESGRWFHSLLQPDYVAVLAETPAHEIVLVRQYRPALERTFLELPAGLLDTKEDPACCAARELEEETGFKASGPLILLGNLCPDQGRLENRLWCYYAEGVESVPNWRPEAGVERVVMPKSDFFHAMKQGKFEPALHIAIVGLAMLQGRF